MKTDISRRLAARLREDPSLFERMDESLLGELVFRYREGELDPEDAAAVGALLQSDSKAREISQRLEAADRFIASSSGQAWLDALPGRVMTRERSWQASLPSLAFFDRLSEWMAEMFPSLSLQAAYSDEGTGEVVRAFPCAAGDPYEAELVRDNAGRWFLRVFTKDVGAARLKLRLEIEPEAPEMRFTAVDETMFFAEVRLSEGMAKALKSGHRPVFRATE